MKKHCVVVQSSSMVSRISCQYDVPIPQDLEKRKKGAPDQRGVEKSNGSERTAARLASRLDPRGQPRKAQEV